ncbi:cadherin-like beta sandwich domain-containing protein [Halalkalibacter oceani]|uniref:cadherin-like beta sandwich domain-containing protein n=1 Tax=Halalkalibacter oceani TaxID=1653776 RepID=UPI003392E844
MKIVEYKRRATVIVLIVLLVFSFLGFLRIANQEVYANTNTSLYYTLGDPEYSVMQMNLQNGSAPETLAKQGAFFEPRAIAVDSEGGYIYYSARDRIYKMKQDTLQEVAQYDNPSGYVINEFALDASNHKLYFSDAYGDGSGTFFSRVLVLDLTNGSIDLLYDTPTDGFVFLFGLSVSHNGDYLYFQIRDLYGDSSIYRMDTGGLNVEEWISDIGNPIRAVVDPTTDELYFSDERMIRKASLSTGAVQSEPYYSGEHHISAIARDPSDGTIYFGISDNTFVISMYRVISSSEAELVVADIGRVNDMVIAEAPQPLTYTLEPIDDIKLPDLVEGYKPEDKWPRNILLRNTGAGTLRNVYASIDGPGKDAFILQQPYSPIETTTNMSIEAKNELAAGNYRATVTITADNMEPVSFQVTQEVHTYSIAPINDQTLTELVSGYASGTQETRSVEVVRTGTGIPRNVSANISGTNAEAFEITQPATTIVGESSSFTVKAKDELTSGLYTATITITADHIQPMSFQVTQTILPSTEARLGGLSIAEGTLTPSFDPDVMHYTAHVPHERDSITLAASTLHTQATYTVYNAEREIVTGPAALTVGKNLFEIHVTAEDGEATEIYVIEVTRAPSSNADIHSLSLKGITLNETVSADVYQYTATVPNGVAVTDLQVETVDMNASVSALTVNGALADNPIPLTVGSNRIEVTILAQDGVTEQTYTIIVTRVASDNVLLSSLDVNEGILSPTFDPSIYAYSIEVSHNTTSVSITPVVDHKNAKLKINGEPQASGAPIRIPLKVGTTNVLIEIEAENGIHSSTYTLAIQRAANSNAALEDLKLIGGTLSPVFAADQLTYDVAVPYSVSQVSVLATAYDPYAVLRMNGHIALSGEPSAPIELEVGSNMITVEVTAQDGMTVQEYQINVNRSKKSNNSNPPQRDKKEIPDDSPELFIDELRAQFQMVTELFRSYLRSIGIF